MASRPHWGSRAAAAPRERTHAVSGRAERLVRALRAHEHRTAAGLLLLLIVVYLWPALIEGHVLAPTALLYLETPWSAVAPHGFLHWTNGDLGDVPLSY